MTTPPRVSYAQNGEDILLDRAFGAQASGFFIDVGAWHPVLHSVTQHFSLRGWRGINIEPNPAMLALLERSRPQDVNLGLALGRQPGRARLRVRSNSSLSALSAPDAAAPPAPDVGEQEVDVEVDTLAHVCQRHAPARIDFLKVDVEGAERDVLLGADWEAFRPRLVVVEATRPETDIPAWDEWEPLLLAARYRFVFFDGLNRFYIDSAEPDLARHFDRPANICDRFTPHEVVSLNHELRLREAEITKLGERVCRSDRLNEELRDSVTWRMTEPVRQVTSRLEKLKAWLDRRV